MTCLFTTGLIQLNRYYVIHVICATHDRIWSKSRIRYGCEKRTYNDCTTTIRFTWITENAQYENENEIKVGLVVRQII